ncbi:hypothetical protein QCA50_002653 [Cerrena zonata]|uniref:Aminopeptidase n=1 Tax=Cerrena zonata TaxID=2478898 RepID=A0AAW0GHH0_9APHY
MTTSGNLCLPADLWPKHYDLTIRTDLDKLEFAGFVNIQLDVKKATNSITFNTAGLTLADLTLATSAFSQPQVISADSLHLDVVNGRATIPLPFTLETGSIAQLKIGFKAPLTDVLKGYYRSAWENNGRTEYYALTQFEPTDARYAFPCWDEPIYKATFSITLVSRGDTVNLSNMPTLSENIYSDSTSSETALWLAKHFTDVTSPEDKWKITVFETTPPMSTYIVAFANGSFAYIEDSYTSPLSQTIRPLRIYGTPDLIGQARFSLDVTKKVLPLYEQLFGIEYPLPKLDTLIASDFAAGAMENWGLITGRAVFYLLNPNSNDVGVKRRIARGQSHEIAHMWFGNITTMAWWDYLYLNEGFASLVGEVFMMERAFPEFQADAGFITRELSGALNLDAKLSSHPVEVNIPSANMIGQLFDQLSYYKAASVLRMLSHFIGEDKFLKGVSEYLKKHLYGSTTTEDLWNGIGSVTGMDITSMMDAWVKKKGFPVVTVTEDADGIQVRQDRFLASGLGVGEDNKTIWTIPLNVVTTTPNGDKVVDSTALLNTRDTFIPLDTSKPFKLNAGTIGFFRVLYTPERLLTITREVAKGKASIFSLEDRMGLINDSLAFAKAGLAPISGLLDLIHACRNETEYLVWLSISQVFSDIVSAWWENPNAVALLNNFRRDLFMPLVKKLGYNYEDNEDLQTRELRTLAITQAAEAGQPEVVNELRQYFRASLSTGDISTITDELRPITFRIAAKFGGQAEWDKMADIALKSTSPSDAGAAIIGVTSFADDLMIEKTFSLIEEDCRDQDILRFFQGMGDNLKHRRLLSVRFREHYDMFMKRVEGTFSLQYTVVMSHESLTTFQDVRETEEFFKDKDTSSYKMTLDQVLETIRNKATWIQRSTEGLLAWFETRQSIL